MRRVVLTYGILAGFIVAVLMVASWIAVPEGSDFSMSEVLGYASMIISLSMIYFGIRNYRDNHSGGSITFGEAFIVGLYITLVASVLYVIFWKIYSAIALPNFAEKYAGHMVENLKKSGASDSVVALKTKELAEWKEMFKNPIFELGITFLEIFPVGLVISLLCALILKRKPKAQAPA